MWQEDMHLAICGKTKTDYYFAILPLMHRLQLKNRVIKLSTASFKLVIPTHYQFS